MSRVCNMCHKRTQVGNSIATRGLAIRVGGVGIKKTGITRRTFKPNVQRVRIQDRHGTVTRTRVCTKCIRSGLVRKPTRREIPDFVRDRMRAKAEAKLPEARRARAAERAQRRRARKAAQGA